MTRRAKPLQPPEAGEPAGLAAPERTEFLLYQSEDGLARVEVRLHDETVWLTQKQLADLYQVGVPGVNEHLRNIFREGELDPGATIRKLRIVRSEGNRTTFRTIDHYALPVVIAVGYRVRSTRGTQFRQWATARLGEYVVKGVTMDDERLMNPPGSGALDYFDEVLKRIRRIRASERRFYQKLTDVYARCSIDYDGNAEVTKIFYATVQNKMHWAIHGHTAAELVRERADASRPHMGLTTWTTGPAGPIRRADVTVAKNYLAEDELTALDRIVSMYLDFAEDQARRRRPMTMTDWIAKLDAFLQLNERNILDHAGKVSHELAAAHAEAQFERYDTEQRRIEATTPTSDFDRLVEAVEAVETSKLAPPDPPVRPRKKSPP